MSTGAGAFSWNSELPSGRNPFWIRDDALSGLGLHPGDAVSVDTRVEPTNGDLVVVEAEIDGDSFRIARRYFAEPDGIRLEPDNPAAESMVLAPEQIIVMGVIVARVRISPSGDHVTEEPLP
jgi:SOS-response transcriptional repressor LexA